MVRRLVGNLLLIEKKTQEDRVFFLREFANDSGLGISPLSSPPRLGLERSFWARLRVCGCRYLL